MILCYLQGGLGNIMFQIAAANNYKIITKKKLVFPDFKNQLEKINADKIHNPIIDYADEYVNFFKNIEFKNKENLNLREIKIYNFPFEFNPFIPQENIFAIKGFFQSRKYFDKIDYKDIFNLKIADSVINNYDFEKSIGIHVRRGDYLNLSNVHPVCSKDYYIESIKYIVSKKKIKTCFLFSDDKEWTKSFIDEINKKQLFKNLKLVLVDENKDYLEMILMSKCSHNVIANSSFSWWSAELNQNIEKIVIAPKKWFSEKANIKESDIIPEEWIRI